ncbi:hypothetical protein PR202_ga19045 [Eleusine coracana subsp. coracana]|uniref:F-box domain-containing protein n=1 Tax=Eleusine coracana subsp. coracana TaxID=191504 RepID=A0AAV5CT85_ELECO|nr:hypothetical protein PR202_ga19045 [Eleusine coracana subsp. coracana]
MGERRRSKRRRKATAAGGADLISGLGDDVLLRILGQLNAREAVRTGLLSRRWRGLWTRAPALRFSTGCSWRRSPFNKEAADRYVSFVDTCLAFHTAAAVPVDHLAISFDPGRRQSVSDVNAERAVASAMVEAGQRWIRHALVEQRRVKSFVFQLYLPPWHHDYHHPEPVIVIDDLPSSTKLETLHLEIARASVQLPITAVFASLTDITLSNMAIADGSAHRLARLLSPECSPRLRKLRLRNLITRLKELVMVAADALEELSLEQMESSGCSIDVRTPSLRVLRMFDGNRPEMFRISAPRLQEIMFQELQGPADHIIVDGEFPLVQNIMVYLRSHGYSANHDDDCNDVAIRLLQCYNVVHQPRASLQENQFLPCI